MAMVSETHLTDLGNVLKSLGVDIRRAEGREISGRCPVHKRVTGREDGSPSWSMSAETGLWICFSCGARGTLSMLVSELTGEPDAIMAVHNFLIDRNLERLTSEVEVVKKKPEVDWISFSKFGAAPASELKKRAIDPDQARMHGIRWDTERAAWIIPIVNQFGDLQGWQTKARDWVRNFVRFASVFDKPQALATFGAAVSAKQIGLLASVADKVIIAMDNDDAGKQSSKKFFKSLPYFRKGVWWWDYSGTTAKDIGDMTNDEIELGLLNSSQMPNW